MAQIRSYTVRESKIKKSCLHGLASDGQGGVRLLEGQKHYLFLPAFYAEERGSMWGRLSFYKKLPGEAGCIVRALAYDDPLAYGKSPGDFLLDAAVPPEEKIRFLESQACTKSVNHSQLLLYEQKGNRLFLSWELSGSGEGRITGIRVESPGDNFLQTFPEIYQEEGGFFHRYLSIFSTIYNDFQKKIDRVEHLPEPENASEPMLLEYASWLGIHIPEGLLEEPALRRLVQEGYALNRIKGTREAVLRLTEIVLGRKAILVERNRLPKENSTREKEVNDRLYGEDDRDVVLLLPGRITQRQESRLTYLLKQYAPARSRLRLVCCEGASGMDSYCYLDKNAVLYRMPEGILDRDSGLNHCRLSE